MAIVPIQRICDYCQGVIKPGERFIMEDLDIYTDSAPEFGSSGLSSTSHAGIETHIHESCYSPDSPVLIRLLEREKVQEAERKRREKERGW